MYWKVQNNIEQYKIKKKVLYTLLAYIVITIFLENVIFELVYSLRIKLPFPSTGPDCCLKLRNTGFES